MIALGAEEYALLAEVGPPGLSHVVDVEALDRALVPVTPGSTAFAAPAFPVSLADGDLSGVSRALADVPAGFAVAIEGPPDATVAMYGGLSAFDAARAGVAAVVVDGLVCDLGELAEAGVPTFARGVAPVAARLTSFEGRYGRSAVCGGVRIREGDVLVGGADGVIVLPAGLAARALAEVPGLLARERSFRERMAQGTSLWEIAQELGVRTAAGKGT